MKDYKIVINPGKSEGIDIFLKISIKNNNLSISGVHGPYSNGNCFGSCGQILDTLLTTTEYSEGFNRKVVEQLYRYWKRWHLNDLTAGTPEQEKAVRKSKLTEYTDICNHLKALGLYEVPVESAQPYCKHELQEDIYKYGHAWLKEKVPSKVTSWLFKLPETTVPPHWV